MKQSMINNDIKDLLGRVQPMIEQPGVGDVISLLRLYTELWKEELVNAKNEDVLILQGAIRKVLSIIVDLKRKVPEYNYKNGAYSGN